MTTTGEQLLDLVMFRVGHRTSTVVRAAAEAEMRLAQNMLEKEGFKPWFLFDEDYTAGGFVTVEGQEYVELPSGFLGLDDDFPELYYLDTTIAAVGDQWRPVQRGVWGTVKAYYFTEERAAPKEWDILGTRIYLRPVPDAIYTLKLPHYREDTLIADSAAANLWSTHAADWLLAKTLEQVAIHHLGDTELLVAIAKNLGEARTRVYRETEQRRHGGRRYEMGSD